MILAIFICPKCARPHSIEEFQEDRFCVDCGKMLTYRNKRIFDSNEKNRSKKKKSGLEVSSVKLFPYTPYPQQLKFMRDVETAVRNEGVIVVEACNGFGKTICALASTLPSGRKIIYATRTHEQVRQVLREVEQINRKARTKYSAVALASRQNLCLNEICRRLPSIESVETCRILRQSRRCPYKARFDFSPSSLPIVLSSQQLIKYGKKKGICPYFLSRQVANESTVVVAPYQYIFNEKIRAIVRLEIDNKILIFDEAHNADKIGQEVLSDRLSKRGLSSARKELDQIGVPSMILGKLEDYMEGTVSDKAIIKPGQELKEDLADLLGGNIAFFIESFIPMVDKVREHKVSKGEVPLCYLNGFLRFLSLIDSTEKESYVAVYRKTYSGLNLIEYRCLDPGLAIRPVVEKSHTSVIMSGTLSPLDLFTKIIGLSEAKTQTYLAIAKPENVKTYIDLKVTTKFQERNTRMLNLYGSRIHSLIMCVSNGALVFFPQRRLMNRALKEWQHSGFINRHHEKWYFGRKQVFVEGTNATENSKIIDSYKEVTKTENGAVLFTVFRGRNAEGSNFPYEEARAVFNVGLPYADYKDPMIKAQIEYFNKKQYRLGDTWYLMDAFRAANQAIGRGIRHRDDWCHFYLLDRRYDSHKKFLSKWVIENGIEYVNLEQS